MEVDKYKLADEIRKSYLKHGKDSWVSIANDILPLFNVVSSLPSECQENWESNYYCTLSGRCQKCEK